MVIRVASVPLHSVRAATSLAEAARRARLLLLVARFVEHTDLFVSRIEKTIKVKPFQTEARQD